MSHTSSNHFTLNLRNIFNDPVRPKQHAITWDTCDRWQHRKCRTVITVEQYILALRNKIELNDT